jgi:diguanylate cyclase (GGDEF)-like protein/PAS domain S-box-containing protein
MPVTENSLIIPKISSMAVDLEILCPKLIHLLLDPVFVVDESGKIVLISEACEQLLGYTANEMTGTPILNYIHPGDLEPTIEVAKQVVSGQSHTHFENRYLHKDGSVVHIQWSARWSNEDRLRIAVARNMTGLRRADQTRDAIYRISEVAHSAETLRTFCDGVRDVIHELFPGDALYLAFFDPASKTLNVPDWSSDEADGWMEHSIETGSALASVISKGQPLLAARNQHQQGPGLKNLPVSGRSDWLGVPLITREFTMGALVVEGKSDNTHYRDADRELLQFVANQVATVVERKKAEEELHFRAHHDPLTGLTNRSLFYDRLETALRSASRNQGHLALLYLDLNEFKRINDAWGHEAGDEVLREVARRLKHGTRQSDTIGRMGGDEFTVLLTDIPASSPVVEAAVSKIRDILAEPINFAGQAFRITSGIGVALYPEDGETAQQLLIKADANMYLNKHGT